MYSLFAKSYFVSGARRKERAHKLFAICQKLVDWEAQQFNVATSYFTRNCKQQRRASGIAV
jgi:hypothetical protein